MEKRVLIVDDEPGSILFLRQLLEDRQYTVYSCDNGNDALKILDEREINVVFVDLMMPGMSGFELCRKIRENKKNHFVWVCAITGYTSLLSSEECEKADFDEHFYKPFDLDLILETTHEAFERLKISRNN